MAEHLYNSNATFINMAAGLDASGTSMTVVDASLLGGTPNYRLSVDDEIMIVTGVSGNVLTVTRGAEGSTATVHIDQTPVAVVLTAGALAQYVSENAGGGGGFTPLSVVYQYAGSTINLTAGAGGSPIPWDTQVFDGNGFGTLASGVYTLAVPTGQAGIYWVDVNVSAASAVDPASLQMQFAYDSGGNPAIFGLHNRAIVLPTGGSTELEIMSFLIITQEGYGLIVDIGAVDNDVNVLGAFIRITKLAALPAI